MNNTSNYPNQFTSAYPMMPQQMPQISQISQMPHPMSQQKNSNYSKFNEVYTQPSQIVEKQNFKNNGNVIHNNLHDNLLAEYIVENYINIDSDDRKIETYPDPFYYTVTFKSIGKTIYKSFKKNNESNTDNLIPETPGPVILRPFKNVKYVKLDYVVLCRYNSNRYTLEQNIIVDSKNNKVIVDNLYLNKHCHKNNQSNNCYLCRCKESICRFCDCNCKTCNSQKDIHSKCEKCFPITIDTSSSKCLCNFDDVCHTCGSIVCICSMNDRNKFLILKIKELKNGRMYSTNTATSDNTFILHVDKTTGNYHNIWITRYGTCTFPSSLLFNLERLTIEFCDNKGDRLKATIIFQCNININNIHHRICLLFGKVDDSIKKNIKGIKMEFPLTELCNVKSWYKMMFNNILSHIKDTNIRSTLNNNYDILFDSMDRFDVDDLIKCDITNNVFFIVGVTQNELNTQTTYDV